MPQANRRPQTADRSSQPQPMGHFSNDGGAACATCLGRDYLERTSDADGVRGDEVGGGKGGMGEYP